MKRLLLYISTFLVACSPLTNVRFLKFPPSDFRINNNILKTNGYYYCEKQTTRYCRRIPSNHIADTASKFNERYISAFFLFNDGYAYHTGGLIIAGVNRPGFYSSYDYCDNLAEFNTFKSAREVFEDHLSKNYVGRNSLHDKGVFHLQRDTIHFQIYQSGSHSLVLTEHFGIILNDTTFRLIKTIRHQNTFPKTKPIVNNLDDLYQFKSHNRKADSTNYLRDNRIKIEK